MKKTLLVALLSASFLAIQSRAATAPRPSLAAAKLAELELRIPAQGADAATLTDFHSDVLELVESNRIAGGGEFLRTAALLAGSGSQLRFARTRYEMLLCAIVRVEPGSVKALPEAWRNLRDASGVAVKQDERANRADDGGEFSANVGGVAGIFGSPGAARVQAKDREDSPEVKSIADSDQLFRRKDPVTFSAEWSSLVDESKRQKVRLRELIDENKLSTMLDFLGAAQVLEHSERLGDLRLAHELALCSLLLGNNSRTRWTVAVTYDKLALAIFSKQRFGTQLNNEELLPVDESGICDSQRMAIGCAPVAFAIANERVRSSEALVASGKFAEAEPIAREGWARRKAVYPGDDWRVFSAQRLLGASLLGQSKVDDAEAMLVRAYGGLNAAAAKIPAAYKARTAETADLLIRLYESSGQVAKAEEWRARKGAAKGEKVN